MLEGDYCLGRIVECVISFGGGSDQSFYRSDLAGSYTVMKFIGKLRGFYKIMEGSIERTCNGLTVPTKPSPICQ